MKESLVGYQEAVIRDQRRRAIGRSFAELTSVSGRIYRDVTITSIDDAGVAVRHAYGTARLTFRDLDSAQQSFFGLDAGLAVVAAEKESRDLAAYDRWIDGQMVAIRDRNAEMKKIAAYDEQVVRANRATLASRQSVAANENPLAKPATSFGSGGSRYSYGYPTYRHSYYRHVYYAPNYYKPSFTRAYRASVHQPYGPVVNRSQTNFADTAFPTNP